MTEKVKITDTLEIDAAELESKALEKSGFTADEWAQLSDEDKAEYITGVIDELKATELLPEEPAIKGKKKAKSETVSDAGSDAADIPVAAAPATKLSPSINDYVHVGCKLPNGLVLDLPGFATKFELNGLNKTAVVGSTFGHTLVERQFMEKWVSVMSRGEGFQPLKSGAIQVANSMEDLHAKFREMEKVRTGLEPLDPESNGVKPATKD